MISRDLIARSALWRTLEALGIAGLQLASLVVLARLLRPADFGLVTLALAIVYMLNLLVENLFVEALIQRDRLDEAHVDTAFWTSFAIAGLLIAVCNLGAGIIAASLGEPELAALLRWMSLLLAFSPLNGVLVALLRRDMKFRGIAVGSLIGRFTGSVLAIGMALSGFGVWSFVGQHLGMFASSALAFWLISDSRPKFRLSRRYLRELGSFALPSLLVKVFSVGNDKAVDLLVNYLFGRIALGYVNFASRIADQLGNLIVEVTHQVSMSVFSRQQNEQAALRESVYGAAEVSCLFALPIFTGLIACAEEFVAVTFGNRWDAVVPLVQLLAGGYMLGLIMGPLYTALKAIGKPAWLLVSSTVDLAVIVAGLFALADFGIIAAGFVAVIRYILTAPIDFYVTRRFIGIRGIVLLRRVSGPPLLAAVTMAVLLLIVKLTALASWSSLARLITLIFLGVVFYGGILWLVAPTFVRCTLGRVFAGAARRDSFADTLTDHR